MTDRRKLSVRCIAEDEIGIFRQLRLEALQTEPASFASTFDDWLRLSDNEWRQRLNVPVFVAFCDGQPAGIMGLVRCKPRKMAHRATLVMVYVRQSARGNGTADALLDRVAAFAVNKGILQLELAVSEQNHRAIRFYERRGFMAVGKIPCGLLDSGKEIAEVIMVRYLR